MTRTEEPNKKMFFQIKDEPNLLTVLKFMALIILICLKKKKKKKKNQFTYANIKNYASIFVQITQRLGFCCFIAIIFAIFRKT